MSMAESEQESILAALARVETQQAQILALLERKGTPEPTVTGRRMLTLAQAAVELGISRKTARRLLEEGRLKGHKHGAQGHWRIGRTELEAYVQRAEAQTAAAERFRARRGRRAA